MIKYFKGRNIKCKNIRASNAFIGNLVGNVVGNIAGNVRLSSYTVAQLEDGITLPADENFNKIVICSDGDAGSLCLAKSNGINWLRIVLGDVVSMRQIGIEWIQVGSSGIGETYIYSLIEFKGKLYAGTGGQGYLCEWNGEDSLISVGGPIWVGVGDGFRVMFTYNNELYVVSQQGCQLWKWNEVDTLLPIIGDIGGSSEAWSVAVHNSKVYLGTGSDGRLLVWNGIDSDWDVALPKFSSEEYIGSLLNFDNKLYGSTYPNGLLLEWDFVSPTWTQVASALPAEDVFGLMNYNNEIYAITGEYAESDPGCLLKWNGFDSWIKKAGQFESEAGLHSSFVYGGDIYAGSEINGLLLKWDKIDSWVKVADQLGRVRIISSLCEFNNKLFGGGGAGALLYEWR